MDTLIIGFGYKKRRGKDTAAQAIIDARASKYDIRRYSFGRALKLEVNQAAEAHGGMLGLFTAMAPQLPSWVQYEPNPDMTDPLSPLGKQGSLLQWWGTEFRRTQDPFYWIKKLRDQLLEEDPQVALITDMRFLNEFAWVRRDKDNRVVRLDRIGFEESSLVTTRLATHASECELDSVPKKDWHYVLEVSDGDVDGLKEASVFIFDEIVDAMTTKEEIAVFPDEQITEFTIDESKEELAGA
jgi:hypothetical protein